MRDDPYQVMFERLLYPGWEGVVRRRQTPLLWHWLEQSQWRSADELAAFQIGALRRLLDHTHAHIPWYRARMDAVGLRPRDLRSVEDLARLPILSRAEARDCGAQRESTTTLLPSIRKQTSGTGGQPLSFGYDIASEHWRQAVKLRGYGWSGYRLGMRTLSYWGAGAAKPSWSTRVKTGLDRGLKRETYFNCSVRSEQSMSAAIATLVQTRPRVLVAYAQAVADLARYVVASGMRRWGELPVIVGAEPLLPGDREVIERAFGPVFETYGSRETMLLASECEAHEGLHVPTENIVLELVVRQNGTERAAQPGEVGEVVVTDLHNFGMPFIRYANGDLAEAGPQRRCRCGRALPRIAAVQGRITDVLIDGEGARIAGTTFLIMFVALAEAVRRYQVVQHRDRSITLRLVLARPLSDSDRAHITRTVTTYCKGLPVRIDEVREIPTSASGKQPIIVAEK